MTREEPKKYVVIQKQKCACNTSHGIAVYEKSIFIQNENLFFIGTTYYRIDCDSKEEFSTAIFWLIKSHFYTPISKCIKYIRKRTNQLEWTLQPMLSPLFFKVIRHTCRCVQFKLDKIPVFCLEDIVLCGDKTGPTISSVLNSN